MINLLKTTANKTLKHISENATEQFIDSCISTVESLFGQRFSISDNGDVKMAEKLLRRLNPDIFKLHSEETDYYSNFGSREVQPHLKNKATFIIPLPEQTYIYVHNSGTLKIFIFGKEHRKAASLFKQNLKGKTNKKISVSSQSDKNTIRISNASFGVDGDVCYSYIYRVPTKTLDEIFTTEENKVQVFNYIAHWKKADKLFSKLNITHKLGILLYGPPGTGKSSMAKAIAHQLDYPLYTMNVSSFPDTVPDLTNLLDENPDSGCIILLEDIDYIFNQSSVERSSEEAARANALLQMLDGVSSSSNIVFIATTNSIESLNDAIIRDGRFDLKICMDNIQKEQRQLAEAMCKSMYLSDEQVKELLNSESFPINPAALQNKCVKYIFSHIEEWGNAENTNAAESDDENSILKFLWDL